MRKNTDMHLKTRTVTVKKCFQELPQVLRRCKKKGFVRTQELIFFGEVFLGFLIGVINWGVH